jgi:rSAM/selenodomain-associated transferase 2
MAYQLSIVMPMLNEADVLPAALLALQPLRRQGHELIVVDGGSSDGSAELAAAYADVIVTSEPGRAYQMNRGAERAGGDILWFLHADTLASGAAAAAMLSVFENDPERVWGRFDVRLSGERLLFRLIEWLMNRRSCWSGIATGDQGIFVRRNVFESLGGYAEIPLMEDIELSKRLKRIRRPACCSQQLTTSSRRWERNGILATVLLMWYLRLAYFFDVSPDRLAARYYRAGSK